MVASDYRSMACQQLLWNMVMVASYEEGLELKIVWQDNCEKSTDLSERLEHTVGRFDLRV